VRLRIKATTTTAAGMKRTSQVSDVSGSSVGQVAELGSRSVSANPCVDSWSGPRTTQLRIWMATKLRSSVVMISLTLR
jgi:hypothetical protein